MHQPNFQVKINGHECELRSTHLRGRARDSWLLTHMQLISRISYNRISLSTATSLFCLPPFNYSIWGIQIQTIFAVLIPKAKKSSWWYLERLSRTPCCPDGLQIHHGYHLDSLLAARFKITLILSSSIGLLFVIGSITISPLLDWVFLPKKWIGSGTLSLFFCPIYYLNYPKKRGTIWLLSYLVKINWHQILIWFS